MIYKNRRTGQVIQTTYKVTGGEWELREEKKTSSSKEPTAPKAAAKPPPKKKTTKKTAAKKLSVKKDAAPVPAPEGGQV